MKPTSMKASCATVPPSSSQGVHTLNTPIRQASVPRVLRRPIRSASQPEAIGAEDAQERPDDLDAGEWYRSTAWTARPATTAGKSSPGGRQRILASAANAPRKMLWPCCRIRCGRDGLQLAFFEQPRVFMRDHQPQPGEQRDDVDRESHVEGIAPAPIGKIVRRSGWYAGTGTAPPASRKPMGAPSWPSIAYQPRRSGGAFRASSDGRPSQAPPVASPCRHAENGKQYNGVPAQGGKQGQERDTRGGRAEQEQGNGQLGRPAPAALHGHEQGRAERPGNEGEGKI